MCEDIKGIGPRTQLIFPLFQKQFWSEWLKQPPGVSWELKGAFYFRTSWDNSFHPLALPMPFSCVPGNWFEIQGFFEAVSHACWFVCSISGQKSVCWWRRLTATGSDLGWGVCFHSICVGLSFVIVCLFVCFPFGWHPGPVPQSDCVFVEDEFWGWGSLVLNSPFFSHVGHLGNKTTQSSIQVPAPQKLTLI